MKRDVFPDGSVLLTRESKAEQWPLTKAGWTALIGFNDFDAMFAAFDDGEFIGSKCRCYPTRPEFYKRRPTQPSTMVAAVFHPKYMDQQVIDIAEFANLDNAKHYAEMAVRHHSSVWLVDYVSKTSTRML